LLAWGNDGKDVGLWGQVALPTGGFTGEDRCSLNFAKIFGWDIPHCVPGGVNPKDTPQGSIDSVLTTCVAWTTLRIV